ncbi:MAG: HesA/MoeB/ThiF family protein [Burkholderiales bacterium]
MDETRYARHALIDWFDQDRLRAARIAVIGAGAVGNEVVKNLALLGAGAIELFDFDQIALHNLTRSVFFRETDVGRPKALVLAERAQELNPDVRVRGVEGDFWRTLSLHALQTFSTVICAVDNFEARVRLNQMCRIVGVDLVNAGIDSRFAVIETFPFKTHAACACYECHLPASAYQRIGERYSCGGLRKRAWESRKVPTTAITASIAGALAVSKALRLGAADALPGADRILVDTHTGRSSTSMLDRNDGCPGCAMPWRGARLLRSGRHLTPLLGLDPGAAIMDVSIHLSDSVITAYECVRCGVPDHASQLLMRPAAAYDDEITFCTRCRQHTMRVEMRDIIPIGDLMTAYRMHPLGAKYVLAELAHGPVCIELED